MPRLGDQLTQTAHDLVALIVCQIVVIELFQAGVYFNQLMNQCATVNFCRVRSQHQFNGDRLHGVTNIAFA